MSFLSQLRVLLVHRNSDNYRQLSGWWSHPVPEFTWDVCRVPPVDFTLSLLGYKSKYDLVVVDDWIFGHVIYKELPIAYVVVDSARSDLQLQRNKMQARSMEADIILLDSDSSSKFKDLGTPVMRFAHCVNRDMFKPIEKTHDVAFLCWSTPPRVIVREHLRAFCLKQGYTFLNGTYNNPVDYAQALCSARIVVHMAHVQEGRSWRLFDVMAARGCLLSDHKVSVSGDGLVANEHYVAWHSVEELEGKVDALMHLPTWREGIVQAGYEIVQECHTWGVRAKQLRLELNKRLRL